MHICKLSRFRRFAVFEIHLLHTHLSEDLRMLGIGPGAQMLKHAYQGTWQLSMHAEATVLGLRWAGTSRFLRRHLNSDPSRPVRDFCNRTKPLSKDRSQRRTLASYCLACSSYYPNQVFSWAGIWGKTHLVLQQPSVMGPWLSTALPQWLAKQGLALCRAWTRWHCSGPSGCPTRLWAWRSRYQEQNKTIW